VTIHVDGTPVQARPGDSVAAALLASGLDIRRAHAASGAPRAPFCMMGVCFECLVAIDGIADRQGCLVTVEPGMVVSIARQAQGKGA
jgi:sarcosine oxidase subunit alpha